ncbi:TRA1 [Auxenochlorella protothecoides x Auxenochlorella symbiontica]
MEEYAEAVVFKGYLEEGRLPPSSSVQYVETEEYLGGVLDFTGELNRYAILRATKRDVVAVQQAKDLVESIFFAFIQFDLRNGSLRKKYDALKYCLRKLENTLYELSLTAAGLTSKPEDIPEPQADGAMQDE